MYVQFSSVAVNLIEARLVKLDAPNVYLHQRARCGRLTGHSPPPPADIWPHENHQGSLVRVRV